MADLQISPYKPNSIQGKPILRACEACYSKKIRCDTGGHNSACSYCVSHGIDCHARTRKRKARSISKDEPLSKQELGMAAPTSPAEARRTHLERSDTNVSRSGTSPGTSLATSPYLFVTYQPAPEPMSSPDAFQNSSYLSRAAILGEEFASIDHSHGERRGSAEGHVLSRTDLEVLKLYKAFDLPIAPLRQSLVDAFVDYAWVWMPVVDLSKLVGSYSVGDGSLLVLQAVLLVGAIMRPEVCDKDFVDEQYRKVKSLLNSGYERDPMHILTALCLIQWYAPKAPKDISTDTPTAWATMAVGLCQQVGLHRPTAALYGNNKGLWRRIWWTLATRDNLMASAHGRPRAIHYADSTNHMITVDDFEDPGNRKASIFVEYVKICRILGDLCQVLTRHGRINQAERNEFSWRLKEYLNSFPERFMVVNKGYDFELAQLHVPILSTISILHRPRSVFNLTSANAAGIVAGNLSFRLLQSIELRGQTKLLSSAFSWHLMATSIPHLSALRVPELRSDANHALDELEKVLSTLGKVRPSAQQNLRNVRAIRRAVLAACRNVPSRQNTPESMPPPDNFDQPPIGPDQLLQVYGQDVLQHYHRIFSVLQELQVAAQQNADVTPAQSSSMGNAPEVHIAPMPQHYPPLPRSFNNTPNMAQMPEMATPVMGAYQDLFSNLFGENMHDNVWMRDWMDDLRMPE